MVPLPQDIFADAIRKGLGRALLHVREYGSHGVAQDIIYACLNNLAYDAQCEETREEWLFGLLEASGLKDVARQDILKAIGKPETESTTWTMLQLVCLASEYARRGDQEAKEAIYHAFDRHRHACQADWLGVEQIVSLDGMPGLLHVAKALGAESLRNPTWLVDETAFEIAAGKFGAEAVMAQLAQRAEEDRDIQAYREAVQKQLEQRKQPKVRAAKPLAEVLAAIESSDDRCFWLMPWSAKASQNDLTTLSDRLLQESRPTQQARYLRAFTRKEMPRITERLFELAESQDTDVRWLSVRALSNTSDSRVREFAIRLLKREPARVDALEMLARNYEPGDHLLVESVLPTEGDNDAIHSAVLDVKKISHHAKDPNLARCLLWVYEISPCATCRQEAIKELLKVGRAPQEMLQECLWDCLQDTRKLAKAALNSSEGLD